MNIYYPSENMAYPSGKKFNLIDLNFIKKYLLNTNISKTQKGQSKPQKK
jgi:hypothetical protein